MKKRQSLFLGLLTAALLGMVATISYAAPPAKVALQGGRIIPVVGEEIAKGTILIEHGKITAIGEDVKVPYDAMVVDVSGKTLFPGLVSPHTASGLDRSNESLPVAPYLDVYDAIDPSSLFFEDSLRDGVLAIHIIQGNSCVISGVSRLVHPIGLTPDEMTIEPFLALKLCFGSTASNDRMSQMATMREAFLELDDYLDKLAEKRYEEEQKKAEKDIDIPPKEAIEKGRELIRDEDLDDKHRNLVKLRDGRLGVWIYCASATDVRGAVATAKKQGFLDRAILVLGGDAYRAIGELKAAGRPVVLPAELVHQRRDPITGKLSETFIPKVIHEAGLPFAMQPSGSSLAERYLTYQAARCVRQGIPRQTALEAITLSPARMLGVEKRLGSLEVDKEGYVLVLSGDPLDFDTWVEKAYVNGILAYDREKDARLIELLGLKEKAEKREQKKNEGNSDDKKTDDEKKEDKSAENKKQETTNGGKSEKTDKSAGGVQ